MPDLPARLARKWTQVRGLTTTERIDRALREALTEAGTRIQALKVEGQQAWNAALDAALRALEGPK